MTNRPPRLLLLHGFLSTSAVWTPLRQSLDGIESFAPDLPGYGPSQDDDGDEWSLESVVSRLERVVEMVQPTHVVGHSMGGIAALALARRLPGAFNGVGVIGLPVFRDRADGVRFLAARGLLYRSFLRADGLAHVGCAALQRITRLWLPLAPRIVPNQPRDVLRTTFQHSRSCHAGSLRRLVFAGLVEDLAQDVTAPVHALHGARDRTAPFGRVKELADCLDWTFAEAPDVGHQVHLADPGLVARWVRGWTGDASQIAPAH